MTTQQLQLRVKHKGGQSVISSLSLDSRVEQLLDELANSLQMQRGLVKVLKGFPPTAVDISDQNASLSSVGFQSREQILVEEIPDIKPTLITTQTASAYTAVDVKDQEMADIEPPKGILLRYNELYISNFFESIFIVMFFCILQESCTI